MLYSSSAVVARSGAVCTVLSGSAGLSKSTSGTVVLSAPNTFTGATSVNAGTLHLAHAQALQYSTVAANAANSLTFAAGVTSPVLGGLSGSGSVALVTTAAEPVSLHAGSNNQNSFFSGALTGAGGLVKEGGGVLAFAGSSTYAGATTVSSGTLQLANNFTSPLASNLIYRLDPSNTGTITVTGGVTNVRDLSGNNNNWFSIHGPSVQSGGNGINGLSVMNFNGSQYLEFSTVLTSPKTVFIIDRVTNPSASGGLWGNLGSGGKQGIQETGSNTWAYASGGGNDYVTPGTGTMYINGLQVSSTADGVFAPGVAQLIDASNPGANNWQTTALGMFTINGQGQFTNFFTGDVGEVLAYSSTLTTLQRQEIEAYLANKWLGAGPSGVGAVNPLPITTPVTIAAGATLDLNGANQQVASLAGPGLLTNSNVMVPAVFTVGGSSSTAFSGQITDVGPTGSLSLTVAGPGGLTLTGVSTYSGSTVITGGTLQLGDGTPINDGSIAGTSGVTTNGVLAYNLNGSQTASYTIGGSGAVTKTGGGTLTLANGNNSYGGGTNINSGLLVIAPGSNALGQGPLNVTGGSLDMEANNPAFVESLAGSGTIGNGASGEGNLALLVVTNGGAFSGRIRDGGFGGDAPTSLAVTGGTLVLSGTNTYSGGTIVAFDGTLVVNNVKAIADGSDLTVSAGGTFPAPIVPAATIPAIVAATVPEPGSFALLGAAGAAVLLVRRRFCAIARSHKKF
jgi:autotransporter-associated beta strand protein